MAERSRRRLLFCGVNARAASFLNGGAGLFHGEGCATFVSSATRSMASWGNPRFVVGTNQIGVFTEHVHVNIEITRDVKPQNLSSQEE